MKTPLTTKAKKTALTLALSLVSTFAVAQACPDKSIQYWQAFPPGGESDLSARHQQKVLKAKCPAIETVVQYQAGAGGALLWSKMNTMPAESTATPTGLENLAFPIANPFVLPTEVGLAPPAKNKMSPMITLNKREK